MNRLSYLMWYGMVLYNAVTKYIHRLKHMGLCFTVWGRKLKIKSWSVLSCTWTGCWVSAPSVTAHHRGGERDFYRMVLMWSFIFLSTTDMTDWRWAAQWMPQAAEAWKKEEKKDEPYTACTTIKRWHRSINHGITRAVVNRGGVYHTRQDLGCRQCKDAPETAQQNGHLPKWVRMTKLRSCGTSRSKTTTWWWLNNHESCWLTNSRRRHWR